MASNDAQLANLRDKEHFPAFEDLAWDNHLDPHYYRERENGFWEPHKHWVFIGEIVEVEIDLRVKLTVKDRDGLEIPVAIYQCVHQPKPFTLLGCLQEVLTWLILLDY
ncbi:Uncharacterized protein HZ326_7594, partial [Fusarium oxysporum f. sp. albedinis]